MKKEYIKPDADKISFQIEEELMVSPSMSTGTEFIDPNGPKPWSL